MLTERATVLGLIRANPPDATRFLGFLMALKKDIIMGQSIGVVSKEDAQPYTWVAITASKVSVQKQHYYRRFGHALPWAGMLANYPVFQAGLAELNIPNPDIVFLSDIAFELNPQFLARVWRDLTDNQVLALYEAMGWYMPVIVTNTPVSAMIGIIFSVCKGQNLTSNWVEKRVDRLKVAFPNPTFADLNVENISRFATLAVMDKVNLLTIFKYIMTTYANFEGTNLASVNWVIEQPLGQLLTQSPLS
ncbi:hypothetical protein AAG570_013024 [Ranatra chinensis]|uniref:Uncharacterized protein n=1 Tax=Ranatra chinensis TaxID=642074 RepID=A0ABD0YFL9_9HEMI